MPEDRLERVELGGEGGGVERTRRWTICQGGGASGNRSWRWYGVVRQTV